ncbi:hypothetical protein [Psychrobacter sp. MES7-P7E]|uniref:hypothetical protein n=1 Tax=Psychrobacter sp. MES7-P7E TaxID=2058322 RepID=UPI000CCB927F|nr:hypothetical protein [Psychrobacter sp. MES7-P7E]PLT21545.1 hypothetical protein CXF62_09970 [Psychrobacter sp. MES7-P7E]
MSTNVTFEEFEKTVFEFSKALAVNDNNGNVSKRISEKAKKLAKEWYQDTEAREEAFKELLAELDGETEPKKSHYATAGETTFK